MKRLKNFITFINESKEYDLFESILSEVSKVVDFKRVSENKYLVYLLNYNKEVIGTLEYHFDADNNPFYDGGEYPDNRWIIELCYKLNNNDEYDKVKLIKVSKRGNYDLSLLKQYLLDMKDNSLITR